MDNKAILLDLIQSLNRSEELLRERTVQLAEIRSQLQSEIARRQRTEQALQVAQAQLKQAERLATLGQLLSTVVHEISNPLQANRGAIELLAEELTGCADR